MGIVMSHLPKNHRVDMSKLDGTLGKVTESSNYFTNEHLSKHHLETPMKHPVPHIPSNLTRQFEIYRDPCVEPEKIQDVPRHLKSQRFINELNKATTTKGKVRNCSDTVIDQRIISTDDELVVPTSTPMAMSLHSPENISRHVHTNAPSARLDAYTGMSLHRQPLANIKLPPDAVKRDHTDHNFAIHRTGYENLLESDNSGNSNTDNNFNTGMGNKKNKYPDYYISDIKEDASFDLKTGEDDESDSDSVHDDALHLFTPQQYWQILFSRLQEGTTSSLEDFHLLLYDYERLWRRFLE